MRLHYAIVAASLAAMPASCSSASSSAPTPTPTTEPWPVDPATGLRVAALGPVPPLPDWPDNPPTKLKEQLGKALFSDSRLSGSGKTVCGNCHFPQNEFQSGGPKDAPDRSYPGILPTLHRNSPSLLNIVYAPIARYDGSHFVDLFDVLVLPFAEANMNLTPGIPASDVERVDVPGAQRVLRERLTAVAPGYVAAFRDAFGKDIGALPPEEVWRLAGKAMAVFLRGAVSRDAPFDRWNAGDNGAMSAAAVRGLSLFTGRARCVTCHTGPFFTDFQFHNVGTSPPVAGGAREDDGRYLVTKREEDRGAFLTPMLRSVSMTTPYLHDGSEVSLARVIARKTSADELARDPNHDRALARVKPLDGAEVEDIVAFLKALDGAALPLAELVAPPQLP